MRHGLLTLGIALSIAAAAGCGSSSDDEALVASGGTGGKKDAGSDATSDATSGGSAGVSGGGGASGSAGSIGAAGAAGTAGSAGESSGGDAGADGGSTGGAGGAADAGKCPDPLNEPNESEANAASVSNADDCDAEHTIDGVLAGKDVDWYEYTGTHGLLGCNPNPTVKTDTPTLRACVFASCAGGSSNVVCAQGTSATSPAGRKGCCSTGGTAELTLGCSLLTASANVFVRVDQPAGDQCLAYKMTYSY